METTKQDSSTDRQVNRDQLEYVQARMPFARRSPEEEAAKDPGAWPISLVDCGIMIRNARPIEHELSLDREGFILVRKNTACANERDPRIVRDRYLEEMTPFIKDFFQASLVVPWKGSVVVRHAGGSSAFGVRGTSKAVHIDFTPVSAPWVAARENVRQSIPIDSYSRLIVVNAWRAVSPPPQDWPLALCDSSSVSESDLVYVNGMDASRGDSQGYDGKIGLASVHHNPQHRWYYFPDLKDDEVILFKSFDTAQKCNVAHTSFDNRRAFPDAKPRESIEARFFVYYDWGK